MSRGRDVVMSDREAQSSVPGKTESVKAPVSNLVGSRSCSVATRRSTSRRWAAFLLVSVRSERGDALTSSTGWRNAF